MQDWIVGRWYRVEITPMVPDAGVSYHVGYTVWYLRRIIPYRLRPRGLFLEGAIYKEIIMIKCERIPLINKNVKS